MVKVKFILGTDLQDLNESLNMALSVVESDKISIKYELDKLIAIVEYEEEEEYKSRLCCDCAFWDDQGGNSLSNFCTKKGKRVRYNCRACRGYSDVRKEK